MRDSAQLPQWLCFHHHRIFKHRCSRMGTRKGNLDLQDDLQPGSLAEGTQEYSVAACLDVSAAAVGHAWPV